MWPFRRGHRAGSARAAEPGRPPAARIRAEWRSLPPVQRAAGATELTLRPPAFEAGLVSWQDPTFLAPLGHQISATAPIGTVAALATQAPEAPGPVRRDVQRDVELPVRGSSPVPRPTRRVLPVPALPSVSGLTAAPPPPPIGLRLPVLPPTGRATAHDDPVPVAPLGQTAPQPPAAAGEGAAATAQRSSPTEAPTEAPTEEPTEAPAGDPAGVRTEWHAEAPADGPAPSLADETPAGGSGEPIAPLLGASHRPTEPQPPAAAPGPASRTQLPPVNRSASATPVPAQPAAEARPGIAPDPRGPRQLGLGAPVPAVPPPVQRVPREGRSADLPVVAQRATGQGDTPRETATDEVTAAPPGPAGSAVSAGTAGDQDHDLGPADAGASPTDIPAPAEPVSIPVSIAPAGGGDGGPGDGEPAAPLLGERPLEPIAGGTAEAVVGAPSVQREFAGQVGDAPQAPPESGAGGVPAVSGVQTTRRLPATGGVRVQRTAGAPVTGSPGGGPTASPSGVSATASTPAPPLPVARIARAPNRAPNRAPTRSPAHPPVAPIADPASAALATGLAQRATDGSIVFSVPEAPADGWADGWAAGVTGAPGPAPPSVQRSAGLVASRAEDGTATPVAADGVAGAGSAGSTPAPPGAAEKPDPDDEARKAYERIRTRLRAELRLDRERAGLITDLSG